MASAGPVPPGLIVFDRYDTAFGAEGPYVGSALILGDGTGEKSLAAPVASDGLGAAWSPDGDRLLVNTWSKSGAPRPGILTADESEFIPLEPAGAGAYVGCFDWSRDGEALLCAMGSNTESGDRWHLHAPA